MINTQVGVHAPLQLADITSSIELCEGVVFEPNKALLVGVYRDELSAYRARNEWVVTLADSFLLETREDICLAIQSTPDRDWVILTCEFLSATARYAFWRITRGQAPEEQYRIEAAHVASLWDRAAMCPDLKQVATAGSPEIADVDRIDALLARLDCEIPQESKSLVERLVGTTKDLFNKKPPVR